MRVKQSSSGTVYGYKLEERISVPFTVVGTQKWLDYFVPDSPLYKKKVWSPDVLQEVLTSLRSLNGYAIDTESSGPSDGNRKKGILPDGLDAVSGTSQLVLFQIGTRKHVYVMEPDLALDLKEELENPERVKILQNAVHDFKFLYHKYKIHMNNVYCTMLAEQVLTAGKEGVRVGLAELSRKYNPHYLISKDVRDEFRTENFGKPFSEAQLVYAARDVFLLINIYRGQLELLKKYKLIGTAHDEMDCIPCTAEMELCGIWLHTGKLSQTIDYHKQEEAQLEAQIIPILAGHLEGKTTSLFDNLQITVNLKSNAEKLEALKAMGLDIEDVQRSTLEDIDLEVCQALAKYTELTKIISTYGENLIARIHPTDGMLHPRFSQLGMGEMANQNSKNKATTIATGRYSSDFQQLPRPRNIYVPVTDEKLLKDLALVFAL
jgi:hypothetical protein